MSMLKLAVDAGLPLLQIQTRDTLNYIEVLQCLLGKTAEKYSLTKATEIKKGGLYVRVGIDPATLDIAKLYESFTNKDATLIFINPLRNHELLHDVGVMPVPKKYIVDILSTFLEPKQIEALLPSFGGLTLHEIGEVIRLTQAKDGTVTPQGINLIRKQTVKPSKGLSLIDTIMPMYESIKELETFAKNNKQFFLNESTDPRIVPKGLLFDGKPGTGKSQGAKYLANEWGVPLFRLDGTVQSKYVGESENNLAKALAQLDNEAPCILLIDEIEKFFPKSGSDNTGTVQRMMGSLLWWLQEHRSRVFVVMTCNNRSVLPPELYREGRIDRTITFEGLKQDHALSFAESLVATFNLPNYNPKSLVQVINKLYASGITEYSHAQITQAVSDFVKECLLTK